MESVAVRGHPAIIFEFAAPFRSNSSNDRVGVTEAVGVWPGRHAAPTFAGMSWFPRPVGPRAAFADLRAFMRQRSGEKVIGALLAVLVTTIIVIEFLVDSKINTAPPPQIVYADSWKADRSDAEIVAQQKIDQAKREAAAREKQRQFQKLEKQLGM